jgi:DNA-binding transcriptional LysR family regulator
MEHHVSPAPDPAAAAGLHGRGPRRQHTAAGAAIGLSQSATSAALQELERMLGAPLFDRVGKRLLLNSSGRALLPRALALLDGAASCSAPRRATRTAGRPAHRRQHHHRQLRAAALAQPALGVLVRRAAARMARAGEDRQHGRDLPRGGRLQPRRGPDRRPLPRPAAAGRPWLRDELLVVASPRLARQLQPQAGALCAVPVGVLRQQVWLLREAGSGTRVATDHELLPHLRAYRRSIELGNSEAIKHAAAEGLGLACLSEWVVADLIKSGRLTRLATTLPRMLRPATWCCTGTSRPPARSSA